MIGDEFVTVLPEDRVYVTEFDIGEGLSDSVTEYLQLFNVRYVDYTSYVDIMGPTAVPKLVVIVTGTRVEESA